MPKEDNNMIQLTKVILKQTAHHTARIITYSGYEHRSIDILNDLGWETLGQRHNKQLAVCVYHRLLSEKASATATTKWDTAAIKIGSVYIWFSGWRKLRHGIQRKRKLNKQTFTAEYRKSFLTQTLFCFQELHPKWAWVIWANLSLLCQSLKN